MNNKYLRIAMQAFVFFFIFIQQSVCKDTLSYEHAYGYNHFLKPLPSIVKWYDDEHYIVHNKSNDLNQLERIDVKTGKSTLYLDYKYYNNNLNGFRLENAICTSDDNKIYIFRKDNDLYHIELSDLQKGKIEQRRLTWNDEEEKNPLLSPDNKKIAFTRNNDLYVYHIDKSIEQRITYDGSNTIMNGYASWVYYEEVLGRGLNYRAFWWSPDSKYIAFLRFDDSPVMEYILTSGLSNDAQQRYEIQRYPVPGGCNPGVSLCLFNSVTNKYHTIESNENEDVYIAFPVFKPDCSKMYYQKLNRGQDTLKIIEYDLNNYSLNTLIEEIRNDWVNFIDDIYFLNDGFIIKSDRSDWSHFYYYDYKGILINQISEGEWNVDRILKINDKKEVYFTAYKDKTTELHYYKTDIKGKNIKKLSQKPGNHSINASQQGKYFIDTYSNVDEPRKMGLYTDIGDLLRELGDSRSELFDNLNLGRMEVFTIPTDDGYALPAFWYLPSDFSTEKKYPVIFSIYGGPENKTVSNSFRITRGKFREFWLAQQGIITIVVDHRGSGHFGRKGSALMHRNLGKWELDDLVNAVKWLRKQPYIDSNRIGITGGSYGGYVAALALTKGADYFSCGIAKFPVTDWRLYDNIYTERYMDTPQENPEGYENASVMKYAHQLRGKLYLVHGDMDDNVHCRHTYILASELMSASKRFDMIIYPNERHGFGMITNNHSEKEDVQFWFENLLNKRAD